MGRAAWLEGVVLDKGRDRQGPGQLPSLRASVSPLHCASGNTEAQRRVGLAQTCTTSSQSENQKQSQAKTPRSQARALSRHCRDEETEAQKGSSD